MPKIPIDYSNCCIYKIEHIENDTLIYVGHTTNFKQRKAQHKKCCNNENNKIFNLKLYTMIRANGGYSMFKMIEVEKYNCNDRREAEKREDEVMKELKANMNTIRSFKTEEEKKKYYEENKEKKKQYRKEYNEEKKEAKEEYYEENKEEILKKKKEIKKNYREKNKEEISKQRKEYREKNKEKIKQQNKEYREKNKEKIAKREKEYYENNKKNSLMI